jgi:metallophosphoesterase superfamily enzyme
MQVNGDWLLTPERAAIFLPSGTAVVADLHLGFNEARRRAGEALPASGLDDTLALLAPLVARPEVRRLVFAGDIVENSAGAALLTELLQWLRDSGVELAGIIPGNHDGGLPWEDNRELLRPEGLKLGGWHVRHGDGPLGAGRLVVGHFHPCLRWRGRISAPCFLVGSRRLVLPALSADAAGVNVLRDTRWRSYRCYAIAGSRVMDFGELASLWRHLAQSERRKG